MTRAFLVDSTLKLLYSGIKIDQDELLGQDFIYALDAGKSISNKFSY